MAWVSPTGHNDPSSAWTNEYRAYDDDIDKYAYATTEGTYLELTIAAIRCSAIQIYARDSDINDENQVSPDVDIDVYHDGEWHNLCSRVIPKNQWWPEQLDVARIVTKARVKFNAAGLRHRVCEFQFFSLPVPVVETDACSNPTTYSLQANGDIVEDGDKAPRRRGFQYFKGDSGDPPDLIEVLNPSFEEGNPPDDWVAVRATLARETTIIKSGYGTDSIKVTGTAADGFAYAYQDVLDWETYKGETVTFGAWVRANSGNNQNTRLRIYDGVDQHDSANCPKDDAWHWLTVQGTIDASATAVRLVLVGRDGGTDADVAYFDGAILVHDDEIVAVYAGGSFGEGEYNDTIEGLDDDSSYRVRAFTQNEIEIAYGNTVTGETSPIAPPIELDLQVGHSLDDVHEEEDFGNVINNPVVVRHKSGTLSQREWGAHRWVLGATKPSQGDTIKAAYVELYVHSDLYDDVNGNWHFQKAASPARFIVEKYNVTGRPRTSASASWVANSLGTGWKGSNISLVTPLQEVIDNYSPTALVLIFKPNTDTLKTLTTRCYDYNPSLAAKLHIEWTTTAVNHKRVAFLQMF